jgi:D-aminopeptidase
MKKKILIMLYQEGVSALTYINRRGGNFAIRRMVCDGNAAAEAIVKEGGEAYVCDVYGKGRDIIENELTKKAERVSIGELPTLCENGLDGVVLVGIHAMNSAEQAFGSYSVNEVAWNAYFINGKESGDIAQAAVYFGSKGIPVVAVTGDLAAVKECQALVGDIPCAVVKKAKIRNVTYENLSEEEGEALVASACLEGMRNSDKIKPYVIPAPYCVQVRYNRADYCDEAEICYLGDKSFRRISALVAEKRKEELAIFNDLRI